MADLQSVVEISKLARELDVEPSELEFLAPLDATALSELRADISEAVFNLHSPQLHRIGALTTLLPTSLTTKIAEFAMGPVLCAKIAAVLNPTDAIKLAKQFRPAFLTEVALALDPKRAAAIIAGLPSGLVIDVGTRMLELDELITLGRFVSFVDVDVALGVVESASASQVLQIACYTEDKSALDAIVRKLPDDTVRDVVRVAAETGQYDDAVTLLEVLTEDSSTRMLGLLSGIDVELLSGFVRAVDTHDAWPAVINGLAGMEVETLSSLANVEETLEPALMDRVVRHAYRAEKAPALVKAMLALDDEHVQVVSQLEVLRDSELQEWLYASSGVAPRLVRAVLVDLGAA